MKAKKVDVLNIAVLILLCLLIIPFWNGQITSLMTISRMTSVIIVLLFIFQMVILKHEKYNPYSFQVIFFILQYLFLFGNVIVYALDLYSQVSWKLMDRYSPPDIARGIAYAICYLQALFTGVVWSGKKTGTVEKQNQESKKFRKSNAIFQIGVILILFLFPFRVYYDSVYIDIVRHSKGYVSSSQIPVNGIIFCFANLAYIGFFFIIASKYLKKSRLLVVLGVLFLYLMIVMSQTGDRRYAVCGLISIILCYMYCYEIRLNFKIIFFSFLAVVFGLSFLSVISGIRRVNLVSFSELLGLAFDNLINNNIMVKIFGEFGVTLFSYVFPIIYYPSQFHFKWGSSLVVDFITILPIGRLIEPLKDATNVASTLNQLENAHVGGSLGGELYGNFGLLSILIAVLFGYVFGKIFDKKILKNGIYSEKHAYRVAVYYSMLYIFLNLVRAPLSEVTRIGVYAVFSLWIIKKFLFRDKSKYA